MPPYAAAQVVPGVRHTRGTPPAVIELDAATWIALATGASSPGPRPWTTGLGRAPPANVPTSRRTCPLDSGSTPRDTRVGAMDIDELRSRVQRRAARIRQDLEDLVRIESVSADPARAAEVQRSAEAVAELFRAEGFEDVADRERPRGRRRAGGDRAQARAGGRADGAALRPPRRAARERPRRVGLPALRADRARRPALRPRRRRRQGRHRGPPRPPSARSATTSASASRCSSRARRRSGSDTLPDLLARAPRLPRRRRHRDRRLRQLGHRRARADHQPARAGPRRRRGAHPDPRRPLRHVGRRWSPTR